MGSGAGVTEDAFSEVGVCGREEIEHGEGLVGGGGR